jgi:hypothetical protein
MPCEARLDGAEIGDDVTVRPSRHHPTQLDVQHMSWVNFVYQRPCARASRSYNLIFRHLASSQVSRLPAKPTCGIFLLLGLAACCLSAGTGQPQGEQAMATKSGTTANRPADTVITPAGPRQREKVREVKPGEVVRRNEDGSLSVEPNRTSKGDKTPSPKP